MNEFLKFSWGHIIAFLAIIFIGYVTFVGATYYWDSNFLIATAIMTVVVVLLLLFFIGAQRAKATDVKFARFIKWERFFLFGSPLIFLLCITPYVHFFAVHRQNEEICRQFENAITSSKQMFDNYEAYAEQRIANYDTMLSRVIANRQEDHATYQQAGFIDNKAAIQQQNMVHTLRLQLLSANYDNLKSEAIAWIDDASRGATTWNVFLMGNSQQIKKAVEGWCQQLNSYSATILANEDLGDNQVGLFQEEENLASVNQGLDELKKRISKPAWPSWYSCLIAIVLYFALLFPYLLQDRYSKNCESIFSKGKKGGNPDDEHDEMDIPIHSYEACAENNHTATHAPDNNDDDYGIFNM